MVGVGQDVAQRVGADLDTGCNRVGIHGRQVANDGVVRGARRGYGCTVKVDAQLPVLEVLDQNAVVAVGCVNRQALAAACLCQQGVAVLLVRAQPQAGAGSGFLATVQGGGADLDSPKTIGVEDRVLARAA